MLLLPIGLWSGALQDWYDAALRPHEGRNGQVRIDVRLSRALLQEHRDAILGGLADAGLQAHLTMVPDGTGRYRGPLGVRRRTTVTLGREQIEAAESALAEALSLPPNLILVEETWHERRRVVFRSPSGAGRSPRKRPARVA